MRTIARFTGANVIGINNNGYQIEKGRKQVRKWQSCSRWICFKHFRFPLLQNKEANLDKQCDFVQTDFMSLTRHIEPNSLDGAYAIEATCHAPNKVCVCLSTPIGVPFAGAMDRGSEFLALLFWCGRPCAIPQTECFREIFKCLKPGAAFVGYEWVMTDKYDPNNARHRHIKKLIEVRRFGVCVGP